MFLITPHLHMSSEKAIAPTKSLNLTGFMLRHQITRNSSGSNLGVTAEEHYHCTTTLSYLQIQFKYVQEAPLPGNYDSDLENQHVGL